ncbi:MAG: right-handed parallel beta-helix repeat-containing protein [Phycisphaerae bacterium]
MHFNPGLSFRFVVISLSLVLSPISVAQIIFVDASATGPVEDGSSWCTAYVHLQDALEAASQVDSGVTEIRVAQGTYYPDDGLSQTPDDSTSTFELSENLMLAGGYAGCSQPDPDDRDFDLFPTILSGDIQQDDDLVDGYECCLSHDESGCFEKACQEQICAGGSTCCEPDGTWTPFCAGGAADFCKVELNGVCNNANNILSAGSGTVIEGLIIEKACGRRNTSQSGLQAFGSTIRDVELRRNYHAERVGGGRAAANLGDCTVERCVFTDNQSHIYQFGDATVTVTGQSVFQDCDFIGNKFFDSTAGTLGVAMLVLQESNVTIDRCRFIGNRNTSGSVYGGAIAAFEANLTITNSLISDNGPAWRGGGIASVGDLSTLKIVNSTIARNSSLINDVGAGLWLQSRNPLTLENSVIWNNQGDSDSSLDEQIYINDAPLVIENSCVQFLNNLTGGNINTAPQFVDADGPDDLAGTADDDYRLSAISNVDVSPCVDAGNDSTIPADTIDADDDGDVDEPLPLDVNGNARQVALLPGTPIGQSVDIGAYEVQTLFATNAGSRYLQITPQTIVSEDVAIRISSDEFPCLDLYVDTNGTLTALPVYQAAAAWATVFIKDQSFIPGSRYTVTVESTSSSELIRTDVDLGSWGDVDNNGAANFADVQLIVLAFQGSFDPATDLEPCIPNGIINFADIQQGILAFQGASFETLGCASPCP